MLELRAVLGAVVKAEGSTYRRPGARLLATRSGEWVGGVSGGCLEGDLGRKAWWRTRSGPTVVTYDSTADDETAWQFGLGCNASSTSCSND
jgi:xanthine/CO dehydrogenase XdhC/CoxF family maturation factor